MNTKKKGNREERNAAKLLNTWAKGRYEFGRVPMSGGLRWSRTKDTAGDITSTSEGHILQFCVEVKAHRDIDFSQLLRPELKGIKILEFWKQCTDDAKRAGKIPLLLCRYNGLPKGKFFVVMKFKDSFELGLHTHTEKPYIMAGNHALIIFMSDVLLETDYRKVHLIAKNLNRHGKSKKKLKAKKTS